MARCTVGTQHSLVFETCSWLSQDLPASASPVLGLKVCTFLGQGCFSGLRSLDLSFYLPETRISQSSGV